MASSCGACAPASRVPFCGEGRRKKIRFVPKKVPPFLSRSSTFAHNNQLPPDQNLRFFFRIGGRDFSKRSVASKTHREDCADVRTPRTPHTKRAARQPHTRADETR